MQNLQLKEVKYVCERLETFKEDVIVAEYIEEVFGTSACGWVVGIIKT